MRRSLTKAEILRRRRDIRNLFSRSTIYRTNGLHLRVVANDYGWSRVLFAATRGFQTAVARNRARRHIREIYRTIKADLSPGFDLAFVIYPGACTFEDRRSQVLMLVKRAGLVPVA